MNLYNDIYGRIKMRQPGAGWPRRRALRRYVYCSRYVPTCARRLDSVQRPVYVAHRHGLRLSYAGTCQRRHRAYIRQSECQLRAIYFNVTTLGRIGRAIVPVFIYGANKRFSPMLDHRDFMIRSGKEGI
jgi:hypothetical protein